jgi:uncharacterized repeat protein (TIGR01451 family)
MKKLLLIGFAAVLLLVPVASFAVGTDTASGTLITAEGGNNVLNYKDLGGNTMPTASTTTIETTVTAMYGIAFPSIADPGDQSTDPNVAVYYIYRVRNDGNNSDVIKLTTGDFGYTGTQGTDWAKVFILDINNNGTRNTEDTLEVTELSVTEDADRYFFLKITPSTNAKAASTGSVTTTASTENGPVGIYTGANSNSYGGLLSDTDETITTIKAPSLTMTRVATVDAPTAYTGDVHDAVPGAVITYTINYINGGATSAESVIIVDKVPNDVTGLHIGSNEAANVDITAVLPTAGGWKAYYSIATTHFTYGYIGTEWVTVETGTYVISTSSTYVKWEKASVPAAENKTLTWGVVIK